MKKLMLASMATVAVVTAAYLIKSNQQAQEDSLQKDTFVSTHYIRKFLNPIESAHAEASEIAPTLTPQKPKMKKVSDEVKTQASAIEKPSVTPVTSNISVKTEAKKKAPRKFSATIIASGTTDTKEVSDESKTYSSQFEVIGGYSLNATNKLSVYASLNKELTGGREESFTNSKIRWQKSNIYKKDKLNFSLLSAVILPTNKSSQKIDKLNFALELNPTLSYSATDKLTLIYLPRMVKNFHEYETNINNQVLVEYQLVQFFIANYQFADKWSIEPTLLYINQVSYKGTERDHQFQTQLELAYSQTKSLTWAIGVTNAGKVLNNELGPNENIDIYSVKNSSIYGSASLAF